jgi:hypothetical protein
MAQDGGVLIDTSRLSAISLEDGFIRAGAGALSAHVVALAKKATLEVLHGQCGGVSVGGFFLNNGANPDLRGFKKPLRAVTGVTSSGSFIRVSESGVTILSSVIDERVTLSTLTLKDVYSMGTNFMVAVEVEIYTVKPSCKDELAFLELDTFDQNQFGSNECSAYTYEKLTFAACRQENCNSTGDVVKTMSRAGIGKMIDVDDPGRLRPPVFCPVYIPPGYGWIPVTQLIFPAPHNRTALLAASLNTSGAQYNSASTPLKNGLFLDPWFLGPPELHDLMLAEARAYTAKINEAVQQKTIYSDPRLPNCLASSNISFYTVRLLTSGRSSENMAKLISSLDPNRRIYYWKSWQTQHLDDECAAATPWGGHQSPISPACALAGVTRQDVVEAIMRKTQDLCPGFDSADMLGSNDRCFQQLMRSASSSIATKSISLIMVALIMSWLVG